MTTDPIADAWKRIRWAHSDGQALNDAIDEFLKLDPYHVRADVDGNQGTATLYRTIDPAIEAQIFDRCERLLGSFLDNQRAALNYLTYQLAVLDAPSNPRLNPDRVEFPIFNDPSAFGQKNRIKQFTTEHRDAIEAIQPYEGKREGLWMLHELAREHRHRILHPTKAGILDAHNTVTVEGGRTLTGYEIIYDGVVKDQAPVLRFWLMGNGEAHVHVGMAFTVCIDHTLFGGRQCMNVVNVIGQDTLEAAQVLGALITA